VRRRKQEQYRGYLDILKNNQPKNIRIELMEIATMTQNAIVGEQT
jgi:hypothetical protein